MKFRFASLLVGGALCAALLALDSGDASNISGGGGGSGVPSIAGTANQITQSGSPGATTLSIPSDFRLPGTINLLTLTQPATAATFTLANNKTFTVNNTLTLAGTDSTTMTFPGASDTVAALGTVETFTAAQTFNSGKHILAGATSGTLTVNCAAVCGSSTLTLPGGTTDFSGTGGASQVVKQTSAGGAFTVARLACADLSNSAGGCTAASANPSATIGLAAVNGSATTWMTSDSAPALSQSIAPTWTGAHTFSANTVTLSGNQTKTAWTTTGTGLVQAATTYTDSSSSGTVATEYLDRLGIDTIAASSATTFTNAYTLWVEPPAQGTNVTLTNAWAAGFNGRAGFGDGAKNAPSVAFNSDVTTGFYRNAGSQTVYTTSNHNPFMFTDPDARMAANSTIGWGATSNDATVALDTGFSRDAAGAVDLGTGVALSKAGTLNLATLSFGTSLKATNLLCSATAPTISSGFGSSPSVVTNNGTCSFQINVGTGGTATSGVIGLPAATNGWHCSVDDITTESATVFITRQTAEATTTATIGNFNTSGAAAAWVASDKLNVSCFAR